jgi:hypothetical protein
MSDFALFLIDDFGRFSKQNIYLPEILIMKPILVLPAPIAVVTCPSYLLHCYIKNKNEKHSFSFLFFMAFNCRLLVEFACFGLGFSVVDFVSALA